jgi:Flp pilus assembly protein TadD
VAGHNETPVIDELARDGARFRAAVSPVPLTLPAHASLLTGLVPRRHGVRDNGQILGTAMPSLAATLRGQGYATAAFVSGYPLRALFGLDRGFAHYDDTLPSGAEGWLERPAPATSAAAAAWLRAAPEPWFLWVHYYDPHDPYVLHPELARGGAREAYDSEVAFTDRALGEVRAAAAATRRPVLTVLTGDHAESFGEHGEWSHGFFVYDTTVLVPLVVHYPGRVPAGEHEDPVRLVDVAPTVLDLLGIAAWPDIDGTSVRALLEGRAQAVPAAYVESQQPFISYGWAPLRAVRDGGRKLIAAPRPELYALATDPGETHDVFAADQAEAARLGALLAAAEARPPAFAARSDEPAVAERLRALGYLGGGTAGEAAAGLADPKDRLAERDTLAAAEQLLRAGDLRGALARFEAVLAADPENRFAVLRSGIALLKLGDLGPAIVRLEHAVRLDPEQPETRFALADALTRSGESARAITQWRETVRLQPRRVAAWSNLGTTLATAGRPREARDAFAEALALEPDDVRLRANLESLDRATAMSSR